MSKQHAEARMAQALCLVHGMKIDKSLEDVDGPKPKTLCEMTVRPFLCEPHIRHRHHALSQVVMNIHDVKPAVVQCMHLGRSHTDGVLHHFTDSIEDGPRFLVVLRWRHHRCCAHNKHGLLRVMPGRQHGAITGSSCHLLREPIGLTTAWLRAELGLLGIAEKIELWVFRKALVHGLHIHPQ